MVTEFSHDSILPFASLNDEQLISILNFDYTENEYFKQLEYVPFAYEENKYNYDLDATEFYISKRLVSIPKTNYISLDELSQLSSDSLTLANMNIRSIPRNLQYFKDIIMHNSSVSLNVIGFTEVSLDAHHSSLYDIPYSQTPGTLMVVVLYCMYPRGMFHMY